MSHRALPVPLRDRISPSKSHLVWISAIPLILRLSLSSSSLLCTALNVQQELLSHSGHKLIAAAPRVGNLPNCLICLLLFGNSRSKISYLMLVQMKFARALRDHVFYLVYYLILTKREIHEPILTHKCLQR